MDPTQRQVLEATFRANERKKKGEDCFPSFQVSYISLQGAGWTKKSLQAIRAVYAVCRTREQPCKAKPANIGVFVGLDKNEWNSIPKETC